MKLLRLFLCIAMIGFLLFAPKALVEGAKQSFVDTRFVRDESRYRGSIVLYHVVRHRPYTGSLSQWLKSRAAAYEKKHKGTYIEIESMDEPHFYERMEQGRRPDAYSFFSGTMYPDRLMVLDDLLFSFREGLFQTDRCIPYCYSGYCKLVKTPDRSNGKTYYANEILAARDEGGSDAVSEEKADLLFLDLRRAGDLIRYKEGFTLSETEPIDNFTDAVCWLGIDRETDDRKASVILDFIAFLLTPDSQQTLNSLGLFSVRADIRNTPPEPGLKRVFRTYESIVTVDPFRWNTMYDALSEDARFAITGDPDAMNRFINRLRECCG